MSRQDNQLTFVNNPSALRPMPLRQTSGLSAPIAQGANEFAEAAGAGRVGDVVEKIIDFGAQRIGLPRGVGKMARDTYNLVGSYRKGRASITQTNAKKPGSNSDRGSSGNSGGGSNNGGGSKRTGSSDYNPRDNFMEPAGSSAVRGGKRGSSDKTRGLFLTGHLSTLEGGEPDATDATLDVSLGLSTTLYSFSTWYAQSDKYAFNLYSPDSHFGKTLPLLFSRLNTEVTSLTSSKYTDLFTLTTFTNYMNFTVRAVELLVYLQSVLAYTSREGYADRQTANEYLMGYYNTYAVRDAMTRLESVLKNRAFPPKLLALIYKNFQLYKTADIEQAPNFRFVPRSYLVPHTVDETQATVSSTIADELLFLTLSLSTDTNAKVSRVLNDIRPNYRFSGFPDPIRFAVYDKDMLELHSNMTRVYAQDVSATTAITFPSLTGDYDDRVYALPCETDKANLVTFGLQSHNINTALAQTNYISTSGFASSFPKVNSGALDTLVSAKLANYYISNMHTWTSSFKFYREDLWESALTGRVHITDYVGNSLSYSVTKYSGAPFTYQRVYFSNRFSVVDSVRKLIDDIFALS